MTDAQALSTFLTVESFMLAVLSLTATIAAPGRRRVSALPVKPTQLAFGVAGVVTVLAVGAVLSWGGIYVGGSWRPVREVILAAILLFAVVAQPVIAGLMAIGLRSR
ncbi:hypothetical protein [Rhodococcus sp. BH5]|uniref:hypothetical protein n=1 Tax=Rhodococcus sp. BH5 TaxID=2871702 RepID=UPI0022CD67C1|nr:hypothetical protein [Rhodococcus sp. BH5]MCZ9633414.1 hypothetical protein [Rhodococcus sp. BH5]